MVNSKIKRSRFTSSSSALKVKAKTKRCLTSPDTRKKKTAPVKKSKTLTRHSSALSVRSPPSSSNVTSPSAMDRALEVQANLEPSLPCFLKTMNKSNVGRGFFLRLPKNFCDQLPDHDDIVILVDEDRKIFRTKYLARAGLSGGWRGYSLEHKLAKGDVLVFQMIQPCVFNVYIVRENELTKDDEAMGLLSLDPHANTVDSAQMEVKTTENTLQEQKTDGAKISVETLELKKEPFEYESAEIANGIILAESTPKWEDVKNVECFRIIVDGIVLDREISKRLREKYYELCCSQNMFLHGALIRNLDTRLVVGIISETVHIADAIRAAKPDTDVDFLTTGDTTLKSLEGLGMSVGFLRDRIRVLMDLSSGSRAMIESRRKERAALGDEARELELKLSTVRGSMERLDMAIDALSIQNNKLEFMFEQVARSPWSRP